MRLSLFLLTSFVSSLYIGTSSAQVCLDSISGIYLRQYADAAKDGYSLLFFFPLGGIIQLDSNAKVDANNYFGDATGFYLCNSKRGSTLVDFHTLYITESGQQRVVLTQSETQCLGAVNDCGDNAVSCKDGVTASRGVRKRIIKPSHRKIHQPRLSSNQPQLSSSSTRHASNCKTRTCVRRVLRRHGRCLRGSVQ